MINKLDTTGIVILVIFGTPLAIAVFWMFLSLLKLIWIICKDIFDGIDDNF
jgi:hypothetical protein